MPQVGGDCTVLQEQDPVSYLTKSIAHNSVQMQEFPEIKVTPHFSPAYYAHLA